MQIYSNTTFASVQYPHFKGHQICRLPDDLCKLVEQSEVLQSLSKTCDVYIVAAPKKMKWTDPFKFRIPKRNEKAVLSCVVNAKDTGERISKFDATVNGNVSGKLDLLVDNMLKKLGNIDLQERMNRLMRDMDVL